MSARESRVPRVVEETVTEEEAVAAPRVLVVVADAVVAEEEASETEVVLALKTLKSASEVAETPTTMAVEEMDLLLRRVVRELRLLTTVRRDATTEVEVPETTRAVIADLKVVLPVTEVAREAVAREVEDALTTLVSVRRSKMVVPARAVLKVSRDKTVLHVARVLAEVAPTAPRRLKLLSPRNELQSQLLISCFIQGKTTDRSA